MPYDMPIKDARVIDGSGLPSFMGDVAVQQGKIAGRRKGSGVFSRFHTQL